MGIRSRVQPIARYFDGRAFLRVWRRVLKSTPSERLPEPKETLRIGKMAELQIDAGILWIPGPAFPPFVVAPSTAVSRIYRFRAGRRALKFTPAERLPVPHGTLRGGKMAELRLEA